MNNTTTLAQQLKSSEIPMSQIESRYGPMLTLTEVLLGDVPNCEYLMEIWPVSLRTYNLMVPNFLNLPISLFRFGYGGGLSKQQIGLIMYAASTVSKCAYCTAHSCTLALRRGIREEAIVSQEQRTPQERAAVAVAEGMANIPSTLTKDQVNELQKFYSAPDIEWIVLTVSMMGYLNKYMDAMGVQLEDSVMADTQQLLTPTGWKPSKHRPNNGEEFVVEKKKPPQIDNFGTYLRVLGQAPGAIMLESEWIRGVPDEWPAIGDYLQTKTGHCFPILAKLTHKRAIRALGTILRDNLVDDSDSDTTTTQLSLTTKALAGLVYATVVSNETLAYEAKLLAKHYSSPSMIEETLFDRIVNYARTADVWDSTSNQEALDAFCTTSTATTTPTTKLSKEDAAAIILTRAISPSPSEVSPAILEGISPLLSPATIIELMNWISIQQLMHRLHTYYDVVAAAKNA